MEEGRAAPRLAVGTGLVCQHRLEVEGTHLPCAGRWPYANHCRLVRVVRFQLDGRGLLQLEVGVGHDVVHLSAGIAQAAYHGMGHGHLEQDHLHPEKVLATVDAGRVIGTGEGLTAGGEGPAVEGLAGAVQGGPYTDVVHAGGLALAHYGADQRPVRHASVVE